MQVIGSPTRVQVSGSLRLAGAGALASESQHMGATPAGARDATRRLFARTLSGTQAINLRSETRLAVTGAITPLSACAGLARFAAAAPRGAARAAPQPRRVCYCAPRTDPQTQTLQTPFITSTIYKSPVRREPRVARWVKYSCASHLPGQPLRSQLSLDRLGLGSAADRSPGSQ